MRDATDSTVSSSPTSSQENGVGLGLRGWIIVYFLFPLSHMNKMVYNIPPFMDIDFMLCTVKTNFNREENMFVDYNVTYSDHRCRLAGTESVYYVSRTHRRGQESVQLHKTGSVY